MSYNQQVHYMECRFKCTHCNNLIDKNQDILQFMMHNRPTFYESSTSKAQI